MNTADEYWQALERGDRPAALEAVKRLQAEGQAPLEIMESLVLPAQGRAGELWLEGSWSFEQELAATAINEGLVHWLCSFSDAPRPGAALVLVACLRGERHELPALVVAEHLTAAGFRGEVVEEPELVAQVRSRRPRAVLLSGTLTSSLGDQLALVAELRATGVPVVMGGAAFGGDERRALALGATAYAATIPDAVRLVHELPARVEPLPAAEPTAAEVEAEWILGYREEITPYVAGALVARHPELRPVDRHAELAATVDHVIGCLAASLVTGDETIMAEVRDWVVRVLDRRGAAGDLAEELFGLLAEPLRGHPVAGVLLAGARSIDAPPERVPPAECRPGA
ncbi:cobalamin B12-binding domain-containing protein [Nocardioides pantholopis]|uniref:cobalamin B12-binding domain-containing protein n=1 Tax=Nocardioides pantholopis TaxID=2483798 RepID=UPI000FD82A42|nr:cobalamin B12-binding domain-containing protein [Nocardioides pantholopis]